MRRRDWMELPKNRFLRGVYLLVQRYLRHNVGMQGAALAFYLLFIIFPLLIFISSLLGLLQLDVDAILAVLGEFLPREVVSFVGMYLTYVDRNPSVKLLLFFGLFFSLYFPMRATNTLMRSVRIAYHLGPPRGALSPAGGRHCCTLRVLIATIALTLTLMSVGDRRARAVRGWTTSACPGSGRRCGATLRFPVAAVAGYFRPGSGPVRPVPGRPPALAEHLARHHGGPGGHVAGRCPGCFPSTWRTFADLRCFTAPSAQPSSCWSGCISLPSPWLWERNSMGC